MTMKADQPRQFLIVRLTAIGDLVHSLPVACALRTAYPQSQIAWVVEGRAAELLSGHPAVDEVIQVPRRWLKSPRAVWNLRQQLQALQVDVALDVQGLTKSAVAAWLSSAKRRIGFDGVDGRELSSWLNNERVLPTAVHVIERNLQLLKPLGVENPAVEFRLPRDPFAEQTIERFLQSGPLSSAADRFAVINPGAGWPSKLWPADRFAELARALGQLKGLPSLVVWGGQQEHQLAKTIVEHSAGWAQLAPPTSLPELVAVLRRGTIMISADTGPLHLAVAVGTPSVGLFGPMPHQRNGPYGPAHIALQQAGLSGSSRRNRKTDRSTMKAITVDLVTEACQELLKRHDLKAKPTPSARAS